MKITCRDIGKCCLVRYDDIGRVEGMIVDHATDEWVVYSFDTRDTSIVRADQIIEVGDLVTPPKGG